MDKQMIEEMTKIIFEKAFENYETSGSDEIDTEVRRKCYSAFLAYCETLYNAGYRKIPENAVVLTKEEFWALSNKLSNLKYCEALHNASYRKMDALLKELQKKVDEQKAEIERFIGETECAKLQKRWNNENTCTI